MLSGRRYHFGRVVGGGVHNGKRGGITKNPGAHIRDSGVSVIHVSQSFMIGVLCLVFQGICLCISLCLVCFEDTLYILCIPKRINLSQ